MCACVGVRSRGSCVFTRQCAPTSVNPTCALLHWCVSGGGVHARVRDDAGAWQWCTTQALTVTHGVTCHASLRAVRFQTHGARSRAHTAHSRVTAPPAALSVRIGLPTGESHAHARVWPQYWEALAAEPDSATFCHWNLCASSLDRFFCAMLRMRRHMARGNIAQAMHHGWSPQMTPCGGRLVREGGGT